MNTDKKKFYVVTAPHFCAGVICNKKGKIVASDPILKWSLGKSLSQLEEWVENKEYTIRFNSLSIGEHQ